MNRRNNRINSVYRLINQEREMGGGGGKRETRTGQTAFNPLPDMQTSGSSK